MTTETPLAYLSFRAGDADLEASRLRQSLAARAGEEFVWLGSSDSPDQPGGAATGSALARAAVVLVVVGPRWLAAQPGTSVSPLADPADPADPVRRELLDAIERRLPMLLVLVRGARAPRAADLPVELTALAQRPSVEIDPARWEFDVAALVELVKPLLGVGRLRAASGTPRTAPMPLDAAQELRARAARLSEGAQRSSIALRSAWWAAVGVGVVIMAAAAWWWMGNRGGPDEGRLAVDHARTPAMPALAEDGVGAVDLDAQAAVAAAIASAAARAADAAAASSIPRGASAQEQARWSSEVRRLREEANAAQQRAAELARRAAEARPSAPVVAPAPATATPPIVPPPVAPAPSPAARPAEQPEAPAAAPPAATARASSLSLSNWAIATTSGCGAGELRAVGTNEITISRTSNGVLVSQAFQGTAAAWRLSTSGSAVFPAPRPTYEIETSGLWTREGARPFRSISRLTVTTRDGGLVPVGARGSQYRTECPGG